MHSLDDESLASLGSVKYRPYDPRAVESFNLFSYFNNNNVIKKQTL